MAVTAPSPPPRPAAPPRGRPAPGPAPPPRAETPGGLLLPLAVARGTAFVALALFGCLHWMMLLEPAAGGRALVGLATAVLAVALVLAAGRLSGRLRSVAAVAAAIPVAALALLAGGAPDELLRPDRWGALAGGIGRGIEALPGVRVPYRGVDEWTRTVIPLGGTALVSLAGLLAFWPRRRSIGFTGAALVALVTLYAVPVVALDLEREFLRGALLALLVLAFLRLEKLRRRDARAAGALAVAAAVLALVLAPALDRDDPWWDYESWALESAASKSTAFDWDHDYGPLDWPRDGRELLRIRARFPTYWKAQNLDLFDGAHWRREPLARTAAEGSERPDAPLSLRRWTQEIEVSIRNLRTQTFVTAGHAIASPDLRGVGSLPRGGGLYVADRTLHRGDSYAATVYTPNPSNRLLAATQPSFEAWLDSYHAIWLPGPRGGLDNAAIAPEDRPWRIQFNQWADGEGPTATRPFSGPDRRERSAEPLLERSDLRRTWELAQRLKAQSDTPFQYLRRIEEYLGRGFSYTEVPPDSAQTITGFLFDAKTGYCQQFSGAMALLLRMGGVPARVSTGFTSGSHDEKSNEWVVRDYDAHSWVEVWFPGYGWVARDPTPAGAPTRRPASDAAALVADAGAPSLGGEDAAELPSAPARADDGVPWTRLLALLAVAVLAAVGAALLLRRRRRRSPHGPLNELERALRRMRREPLPPTTLAALEARFAATPAASGYVRALREQRYRDAAAAPTGAQRRGLRHELARGTGVGGRVRAWWALPPVW
jgi:transglutaminase-like putative cysteine protease